MGPCSVLDTWREARTLARVTLVALSCATASCRVLCPGDTVVLRRVTLVSTPRCACSTTGWRKPWPATKSDPTSCRPIIQLLSPQPSYLEHSTSNIDIPLYFNKVVQT